jgi:hypothetical protein
MTQQQPITPPPELVEEWFSNSPIDRGLTVATRAAQWGADQELGACCALMDDWGLDGEDLMQCRRPKPPSLKEQALAELAEWENVMNIAPDSPIRRVLEQLSD